MLSGDQPKPITASDLDINIKNSQESPTDTVSSISWTPSGNNPTFATSDWASFIRIYSLNSDSSILTQKACFDTESPCLSVKWHENETEVFAGCTDGSVKLYDVASGKCSLIGKHKGPVKGVHWISESNTLLTVSFDKTVRFWDPRQAKHVAGFELDYKPFCSDVLFPYLAIGMSEGKCLVVDLTKAEEELGKNYIKYRDSPLGTQTQITSIKFFKDSRSQTAFGISGNDGRCNVSNFPQNYFENLHNVITVKVHKTGEGQNSKYFPVNCFGFHPLRGHQFLSTGGGEGKMYFWDLYERNKIAEFDFKGVPVNQVEIDPTGKYMAYALGYDWARGIQGYMTQPSKVCVHVLKDTELEFGHRKGNIKYP